MMMLTEEVHGDMIAFKFMGEFTFRDYAAFEKCKARVESGSFKTAHFDLSELTSIQTTAIGMLLILGDTAEQRSVRLKMTPPQGPARRMLALCRIDRVFQPFSAKRLAKDETA